MFLVKKNNLKLSDGEQYKIKLYKSAMWNIFVNHFKNKERKMYLKKDSSVILLDFLWVWCFCCCYAIHRIYLEHGTVSLSINTFDSANLILIWSNGSYLIFIVSICCSSVEKNGRKITQVAFFIEKALDIDRLCIQFFFLLFIKILSNWIEFANKWNLKALSSPYIF